MLNYYTVCWLFWKTINGVAFIFVHNDRQDFWHNSWKRDRGTWYCVMQEKFSNPQKYSRLENSEEAKHTILKAKMFPLFYEGNNDELLKKQSLKWVHSDKEENVFNFEPDLVHKPAYMTKWSTSYCLCSKIFTKQTSKIESYLSYLPLSGVIAF